jgi:hypothetical protein
MQRRAALRPCRCISLCLVAGCVIICLSIALILRFDPEGRDELQSPLDQVLPGEVEATLVELRRQLSSAHLELNALGLENAALRTAKRALRDSSPQQQKSNSARLQKELKHNIAAKSQAVGPKVTGGEQRRERFTSAIQSSRVQVLAFHFPQFHAFSENNALWGRGFTEWSNVRAGEANDCAYVRSFILNSYSRCLRPLQWSGERAGGQSRSRRNLATTISSISPRVARSES